MRTTVIAALVALLGAHGTPVAQVARSSAETASLSGTVRDHAGAPVRLAIVTLASDDMPSPRSRLTGDDGRFSFATLPAGRFTLTASKAAYVTSEWGARRAGRPGTPLILLEGERRAGVELAMPRGGVITGIIRDVNGQPVEHAEVAAIPARRALVQNSFEDRLVGVLSDDRGRYRIFGLAPGEYLVVSTMRRVGSGAIGTLAERDIDRLIADARARPAALAATLPPATPGRLPAGVDVTTYYPGTGRRADAVAVMVNAGEERGGVDFAMTLQPAAVVSGRLVAPGGRSLPNISMAMTPATPWVMLSTVSFGLSLTVRGPAPDGTFSIPGVPPGEYTLVARSLPSGAGRGGSTPEADGSEMLWAHANVVVSGEDVTGLVLTMQHGLDVRGRFVFDDTGPAPEPAAMGGYRLTLKSAMTAPAGGFGLPVNQGIRSSAMPDQAFRFPALIPDRYEVTVSAPPELTGWWPRSAIANGRDALDYGLDVRAPVSDLVVTFTREETTFTGTLTAGPGIPAPGYVIVVFPEDQAMWRPNARRIRADRPADDGTFRFERLPAGAYRVAALTDIEEGEWNQPAFLEQLLPASQPVTVADGVETRFDIRIAR